MPEIGLLPLARVALQVATQVLPPYRRRFSKHQFTRPQLLAVLCLMRDSSLRQMRDTHQDREFSARGMYLEATATLRKKPHPV